MLVPDSLFPARLGQWLLPVMLCPVIMAANALFQMVMVID